MMRFAGFLSVVMVGACLFTLLGWAVGAITTAENGVKCWAAMFSAGGLLVTLRYFLILCNASLANMWKWFIEN